MQTILLPEPYRRGQNLAPSRAIHRLRSRQESSELRYWLSLASYDTGDSSFSNKVYFVYLVVFLGFLLLASLAFVAQGAPKVYEMLGIQQPATNIAYLSAFILYFVAFLHAWQASRSCPLRFSEEDRYQLCMQPLPRSFLVLRWSFMPWIKSLFPLLLIYLLLGFSYAEILYPGLEFAQQYLHFFGYSLRMAINFIPWHLFFFLISWSFGLLAQNARKRFWVPILALLLPLLFILSELLSSQWLRLPWIGSFGALGGLPRLSGYFRLDQPFEPGALLLPLALVILVLILLGILAQRFDPLRAAAETAIDASVAELRRYGFINLADGLQARERLGVARAPQFRIESTGAKAFLTKAWLAYRRSFKAGRVWDLIQLAFYLPAMLLAPSIWLQLFLLTIWAYSYAQFALGTLRADLAQYHLLRLTPLPVLEIVTMDLVLPYFLSLSSSILLTTAFVLLAMPIQWPFLLLIPPMLASACLAAAAVLLNKSEPGTLLTGNVPNPALDTTFAIVGLSSLPIILLQTLTSYAYPAAILAAIMLAWLAYWMLVRASKPHKFI